MKVSFKPFFGLLVVAVLMLIGCAGMDVRVDSMPGSAYRAYQPRIAFEQMPILDQEPIGRRFVVVGRYIGQETNEVFVPRSMPEIVVETAKKAWEDGADAVIMGDYDTRKVTGYRRDTGVVKLTGIRYVP
jgi:hypothetical protein